MAIIWNNVAAPQGVSGSFGASIAPVADIFRGLSNDVATRQKIAQGDKALAQDAAEFQLQVDARDKILNDEKSLLARQAQDREFTKTFFGNQRARLDNPEFRAMLAADPEFSRLTPEQQEQAFTGLLGSLGPNGNIRDATVFARAFREQAGTGDRTNEEIDLGLTRALSQYYPTASPEEIKSILTAINSSNSGASGGSQDRQSKTTISDTKGIQKYFEENYPPEGIFANTIGNTPNSAHIGTAIAFLHQNNITDPTTIQSAISLSLNKNGTIKKGYDWADPQGQEKLLKNAVDTSNGLAASSLGQRLSVGEMVDTTKQILDLGKPTSVTNATLLSMLKEFSPKQQKEIAKKVDLPAAVTKQIKKDAAKTGKEKESKNPKPPSLASEVYKPAPGDTAREADRKRRLRESGAATYSMPTLEGLLEAIKADPAEVKRRF